MLPTLLCGIFSSFIWRKEKSSSEESSNGRKSQTFFPLKLFSFDFFFRFIWKQRYYINGRPLILKLFPNDNIAPFTSI